MALYPTVNVAGSARERGRSYGEQARDRVNRSCQLYAEVFAAYAGWDWARVRKEAARFADPIAAYDQRYLEEIIGIAEGARLPVDDLLAINVRTEVMFSAKAREASGRPLDGCSAVAVLPSASATGHTLLAQNWDWLDATRETVIVLEAEPDDGPAYVSIMEAGLLAKMGMNQWGIGVATNALVSDADRGEPGVPYHVCLRSLLDARTPAEALERLQRSKRSSSANYLVATTDGLAFDAEGMPGGFAQLYLEMPHQGRLLHTNHFVAARFPDVDVGRWLMPDSPLRLERLQQLLDDGASALTVDDLQRALADHAGYPSGICCHADNALDPVHSEGTVASMVMDLQEKQVWLADGNPCQSPYRLLDWQAPA